MSLKQKIHLRNIEVQSETTGADAEAAACYPDDLLKTVDDGNYTKQQIF